MVFITPSSTVKAYKITATTPPTIVFAWSASQTGKGSPWVTTTDGTNNVIVWVVGAEGDQRLHGYDGDTGVVIYAGGGANELMTGTRKWNTGIVARGSIYFVPTTKFMLSGFPQERLHLRLLLVQRLRQQLRLPRLRPQHRLQLPLRLRTPTSTPTATAFRQSDAYTQTDAYCQTACDTEAAPDSAAKAHALTGQYIDCQWFVALTNES